MCTYQQGVGESPNEMDAAIYSLSELLLGLSDMQFIPAPLVLLGCNLDLPRESWEWKKPILGISVPVVVNEQNPLCLCLRQGRHVHQIIRFYSGDGYSLSEKIESIIRRSRPEQIVIEDTPGSDIGQRLRQMGYNVRLANLASKDVVRTDKHHNLLSQYMDRMKVALSEGVQIPDDPELTDSILAIQYTTTERGVLKVDDYEDVRKRGQRPHFPAVALALTYAVLEESIQVSEDPEQEPGF
jgi:hypothetical protein